MKKVFVSSVMRDFAAQRHAARNAVEALRLKPVMAEDIGAKPYSSKVACLEGVRQSDIYVGILGPSYGFVTQSGVAVTEEEFAEARKLGLPILWFVQKGDREVDQQAFYDRLRGYEDGFVLDFFDTPDDLQMKVTRAINDHLVQPGVTNLDPGGASLHLAKYIKGRSGPYHATMLSVILFPSRHGEVYFSPLDMGRTEIKERLLQRAMFGASAILNTAKATETVEGTDHLTFVQKGVRGQEGSCLQFFADGTLVWNGILESDDRRDFGGFNLVRQFVIDEDDVHRQITAFINYASGYYAQLENAPLLSSFYVIVVFHNMNQKWFGHHPKNPPSTMSMAMDSIEDPLRIPSDPLKVARAELTSAHALAAKLVALIERTFKARKRYYNR